MKQKYVSKSVGGLAAVAVFASLVYSASYVGAADHLDAPAVTNDGRTDINDLYAFQSPRNPKNTVLIMTVNPLAGVLSGTTFDPKAEYTFSIDSNGDAIADTNIVVDFDRVDDKDDDEDRDKDRDKDRRGHDRDSDDDDDDNEQEFKVRINGKTVAEGETGETEQFDRGRGKVTAGVFDDPFFFDLNGFNGGFAFTGDDFFAGKNVSAIVIELPSSVLARGSNIGVWATTSKNGSQIDRIGRPAINTVLIPSNRKDEFNRGNPANDLAAFGDDVRAAITSLSSAANADALTPVLLPDVLTFDTSSRAGFLNGRQLANDVIDAELNLLSAGGVTTDGVDANDKPFRNSFPYLAKANK